MNRRNFLRSSAVLSTPLFFSGVPVFAGSGLSNPLLDALSRGTSTCNKILVIIQMNGGNDGLNMVIPIDKYTELGNARSNVLIPFDPVYSSVSTKVSYLPGSSATGLHPAMGKLRDMFANGKVAIVQGVSYPNPNYSHFQAQDIWFSGINSAGQNQDTGWLGRELNTANPGYPTGYPNTATPDPLAIQIGGSLPLSLQGPSINMGYNVPNPASLISVATQTPAPAPASDYGTELTFLRMMKDQSNAYTSRIQTAYGAQTTQSTMYAATGNTLSDQLKVVARLIGGGLATQVYVVNHPDSFDTHTDQVLAGDHGTGYHANILGKLSLAIAAFQDDLTLMGKANKVTGMTFSEFGRRVMSNASTGTDHGAGAPVIFFGAGVNGYGVGSSTGIFGTSPILPTSPTSSTQVPTQFDFRQLYATVMQDWMCMDSTQSQTILGGTFSKLGIFNMSVALPLQGIELSAAWQGNAARLNFVVDGNDATDHFMVERSSDAVDFVPVGTLSNYSNRVREEYNFEDERISSPEVFYRIKGYSKQGDFKYSNTVRLQNGAEVQVLRVYPNPVTNHVITVEFLKPVNENVELSITGMHGEQLYYNQVNPNGTKLTFRVSDAFTPETLYVLRISYGFNEIKEKIIFSN